MKPKALIGAEPFRTLYGRSSVLFFVLRSMEAMDLGRVLSRGCCIYFFTFIYLFLKIFFDVDRF